MDCVLPSTECFYTPDRDPLDEDPFNRDSLDKDPFDGDPFGPPVQPALLMLLPPKGIYPLFDELYKSIQAFAKEHRYSFRVGRSTAINKGP